jgi:hypothetical protein
MFPPIDGGPISAQTIPTIAAAHDLLDQVWGWAQVVGAFLAVVALWFAKRSLDESERTTRAATRSRQLDRVERRLDALGELQSAVEQSGTAALYGPPATEQRSEANACDSGLSPDSRRCASSRGQAR